MILAPARVQAPCARIYSGNVLFTLHLVAPPIRGSLPSYDCGPGYAPPRKNDFVCGHAKVPANVATDSRGRTRCRECYRSRHRARYRRMKGEQA